MTLLLFLCCASISKVLAIWHQPSLPLFEHWMVWMHFFMSTTISSQIGNKHNYWKNPGLNDFEPSWDSNPWQLHLKFLCNTFFCVVDSLCLHAIQKSLYFLLSYQIINIKFRAKNSKFKQTYFLKFKFKSF